MRIKDIVLDWIEDVQLRNNVDPDIARRTHRLLHLLEVPETHEVIPALMEHGTIEIEITEGSWKMSAEVGKTSANWYSVSADGTYKKYTATGEDQIMQMAVTMNENM